MVKRWSTREHYPALWEWAYPYRADHCERCGAAGAAEVRLFNTGARGYALCGRCWYVLKSRIDVARAALPKWYVCWWPPEDHLWE